MSRNAVNFDNPKLLILLGESGHGKSSFVNYLAAKDPDNKELYIAKEGESIFSVGTKQVEIYSFEREDFGKLILVDTEGMNDPENDDNSKIIFNIFHALFSQNSDYVVDAIVYFEVAGKPKFQYEKHLKLFCQIFQLEFEEIQKSTIFVHSKYNNLAEIIKATEHKKKMDEIQAKFKDILQIKWDNKFPFKDQLKELKMATSKTKKFTLTLNAYIDEITEIAKKLREEDIIYDIDYLLTGIICTSVVTVVAQLPVSNFGIFFNNLNYKKFEFIYIKLVIKYFFS